MRFDVDLESLSAQVTRLAEQTGMRVYRKAVKTRNYVKFWCVSGGDNRVNMNKKPRKTVMKRKRTQFKCGRPFFLHFKSHPSSSSPPSVSYEVCLCVCACACVCSN